MKALIVGGAGFVGSYLIDHLRECKWSICVTKMQHEDFKSDVEIFDLNILIKDDIVNLLNEIKPDYIFHLAAQSSVALSWKNPALTIDVNIKGAVNLLDAVRELDYKPRILLIGSGEEYGHIKQEETPITEDNATRPGNIYAATKVAQNLIGKIYSEAYNMDIVMVRAFNHIGPNQTPMFVVADFCKQVAEIEKGLKEPVIKVGNLSAQRDFTDVRDVVKAYALLVQNGKSGETYNVGSGKAIAIDDVLKIILSMTEADIKIEVDENKLRPVDVPIIEADVTKLTSATGWHRSIKLEETIADTLNYWRLNIN
ncbi:MAG: GDP-mannose 4,6-dehydratase [Sedimentibacter saalensis]|uniref:GDP-mannose 4,6-dehydratase n=1 Tax=Sedimentibacter saalensis TaxID=130788 RepID=UPI002B211F76|nr:GDP-mannose 4,6-dehydratase [Sedimentibacter saalensis]MEA5093471.1 GDP-mannose 4,6-dehydratase [Sedimentibacter saalensis]